MRIPSLRMHVGHGVWGEGSRGHGLLHVGNAQAGSGPGVRETAGCLQMCGETYTCGDTGCTVSYCFPVGETYTSRVLLLCSVSYCFPRHLRPFAGHDELEKRS